MAQSAAAKANVTQLRPKSGGRSASAPGGIFPLLVKLAAWAGKALAPFRKAGAFAAAGMGKVWAPIAAGMGKAWAPVSRLGGTAGATLGRLVPSSLRQRPVILWAGLSAIAVAIGLAAAWYFLYQGTDLGGRLRIAQNLLPQRLDVGRLIPFIGKSHTVKSGENLWSIAQTGGMVESPWEWRTILVQNKDKIAYSFISEEDGGWKIMVDGGQQLRVRGASLGAQGATGRQYAVQVHTVSANRLNRAVNIVRLLLKDGTYAYLYRQDAGGKSWYRIRAGFFPNADQAKAAGQAIVARYPKLFKEYWVMVPEPRELRGDQIEFGMQRVKPWALELPQRSLHAQALADLKAVSSQADFAYISQRRSPERQFVYHTRIGFFGSEKEARDYAAGKKSAAPVLAQAQVVRVDRFDELMPGQNLKMADPVKGSKPAAAATAKPEPPKKP
jgi:hypothetical protein